MGLMSRLKSVGHAVRACWADGEGRPQRDKISSTPVLGLEE